MRLVGWLALGAIFVFARAVTYVAGIPGTASAMVLAAAIAVAGPTWIGRLTTDLLQALLLTAVGCAIGTVALWSAAPVGGGDTPRAEAKPTPWVLRVPIAVATVGVVWAAFGSHFWDEHSCHYSTAAVIARGVFPPEHPLFPGEPFRYHFGYDVLAAHVRASTGVRIDRALDVATLFSFALLLAVCRDLGRRLGGTWGGGFMMLLVPLGGGTLAFLLFGDMGPLELHWSLLPNRWMSSTPPPVISNFFQHPQGLGMSFGLTAIAIFARLWSSSWDREAAGERRRRLLVGAFIVGVLALVHIVFFAVVGLALGAAVVLSGLIHRQYRAMVEALVALVVAFAIGYSLGGFFAPGPPMDSVLVWGTSFFTGTLGSIVAQHLVLFGLPLLLLPLAVYEAIRNPTAARFALVCAALVGFLIPNAVTYARSWDIVKFLGVGMFFANVLFALRLADWVRRGRTWALGATLAAVLATNTAWIWLVRVSVLDGRMGVPKIHFPGSSRLGHVVGRQLEDIIAPRERVFTTDVDLARAAGFLTPGFDWRRVGVGFMLDRPRAERWFALKNRARRNLDPAAMRELGVRWAVFSPRDVQHLDAVGQRRLKDPEWYEPVADLGHGANKRWVYHLRPKAYGGD